MSLLEPTAKRTGDYAGPERRKSPRIDVQYPACIRFASERGQELERYSHTINVSADGILLTSMSALEPGVKVDVSVAVSTTDISSIPAAQLNGVASVVRSTAARRGDEDVFLNDVALKFVEKPTLSTEVSMFD